MAIAIRLPVLGWLAREDADTRIKPDKDIDPHAYSRQDYIMEHLERHAPELIGQGRIAPAIRVEAVERIAKLNAAWSRERES